MREPFWRGLAAMDSAVGLEADWRSCLGQAFDLLAPFLVRTCQMESAHPCIAKPPCGCRHAVRETRTGLKAVCLCEDAVCEPFPVAASQLGAWELDRSRFDAALRAGLLLEACRHTPFARRSLHEIGAFPQAALPVCLALGQPDSVLCDLEEFWSLRPGPVLVLIPAPLDAPARFDSTLARNASLALALSTVLEPLPGGPFQLAGSLDDLIGPWLAQVSQTASRDTLFRATQRQISAVRREVARLPKLPEPVNEEDARRLFALVKQMDTDTAVRKAPLLQVFRLYCQENRSAAEVARDCGCSKALVVTRLAQLRRKLGRDPAQLRVIAGQFETMEEGFSDWRARKIQRRQAANLEDRDENED